MQSFARTTHTQPTKRPLLQDQIVDWLSRVGDLGILSVIFLAPLFLGGRGPVGTFVCVALISVTVIAWFMRQCFVAKPQWRWSGVEWLILLGGLLALLQLIPLPQSLLFRISPMLSELLPLWQSDASVKLGIWSTISLTPEDTRAGVIVYLAYALFFLVLVQRIDTLEDLESVLKCLALATIMMASIGMLQRLSGNGKFLWIYEHPTRDTLDVVKGTFTNQNHFAHFLALGVGPLIWWLQRLWITPERASSFNQTSRSRAQSPPSLAKHLLAVGFGVSIIASLLTYSRGGVVCVALVTVLTVVIYWWKSLLGKKALAAIAAFGIVVGVALTIYGHERLSARLGTLAGGSIEQVANTRMDLWKAHWKAIPRFPLFGTGVGSHRDVYRIFMEKNYDFEFSHGENGYFQLLLEAGFTGGVLLVIGFWIVLRWCLVALASDTANRRLVAMAGAILPAIVASLLHSWGDFVWYIPACMTLTIVSAACACRMFQLVRLPDEAASTQRAAARRTRQEAITSVPHWTAVGMASLVLICGFASIKTCLGPARAASYWDAYYRLALSKDTTLETSSELDKLATMEYTLEQVLQRNADDARALLRLAAINIRRFELEQRFAANPMGLSMIRDAALASKFASKEAQDAWLQIAIGDNVRLLRSALSYCRRALRLSPLQGPGYINMADLTFLEDPRESTKDSYIRQAVQVRPFSGLVLLALGKEAAISGNVEAALQYWRKALQNDDTEVRVLVIETLAGQIPTDYLLTSMQPDSDALRALYSYYHSHSRPDDARLVGVKLVNELVKQARVAQGPASASLWFQAQDVYSFLGKPQDALTCQWRAVELTPTDFDNRRKLASLLTQNQQYAAAAEQLEWCLRRHPDDSSLKEALTAVKCNLSDTRRAALAPAISKG